MIRRTLVSLLIVLALLQPSPAPAQIGPPAPAPSASWVGKYSGSNLDFELKPTPLGGLSGVITFEGNTYIATAKADGERLTGNFRAGSDSHPYEVTREGNSVRFVTGGTEYRLQKAGAPAATNPLARGGKTTPAASASEPARGQLVTVGLGFSFRIPEGWTSKETPEGAMLLPPGVRFDPNRNDNPEVYLVAYRHDYDPREEAQTVQQLSAAVAENGGRGGQRQPARFGPRAGASYQWEFRDPASGKLAAFDIHLAPEGSSAFALIAVGEKARIRAQDTAVRQIMSTLAATTPKVDASAPLADSTPLAQRWLQKLRGKVVRQFWASQGMSSDKKHWLNADGTYAFQSSSMVSVDVPGAGALSTDRDAAKGRWAIRDLSGEIFLEVRLSNGNVQRMRITEDNRNWYLNGEKAFAVDP